MIASLVKHEYPQGIPVFNFEVQGDHTYFVGKANGGTWVHNDCTDIAADIIKGRKAAGLNPGEVWNVQNPHGRMFFYPPGGPRYAYHDVVRVGDNIIDTLTHSHAEPVPVGQWMKDFDIKSGGDGQFGKFWQFSPGSGEPDRFAGLMGR